MDINDTASNILQSYVYVYIDPRNNEPFYIGKGKGSRATSHLNDQSDSAKVKRIDQIRKSNKEPIIEILRYGLTDTEACLVEAAAIDLLGKSKLANRVSGHHEQSYGRIKLQELLDLLAAKPIEVQHKAVLITINKMYRSDMTDLELYEATRGIWRIGERRNKAEYVMAVYQGVVRQVYRIQQWHPAGTLPYKTRDASDFKGSGRWEFEGEIADEICERYVGRSVGKGSQNPIRYANI